MNLSGRYHRFHHLICLRYNSDDVMKRVIWLAMGQRLIEHDGVLYRHITTPAGIQREQLLLPSCLHDKTLHGLHDEAGHQVVERTEALVRERRYWVGLHVDVKRWVEKCERCVVFKMPHVKTKTPLGRLSAKRPLEVLAIDFTVLEPSPDGPTYLRSTLWQWRHVTSEQIRWHAFW